MQAVNMPKMKLCAFFLVYHVFLPNMLSFLKKCQCHEYGNNTFFNGLYPIASTSQLHNVVKNLIQPKPYRCNTYHYVNGFTSYVEPKIPFKYLLFLVQIFFFLPNRYN